MNRHITEGMKAPDFKFNTPWEQNLDFHRAINGTTTVLFFLRYMGCPICQYKISEIMRDMDKFNALGTGIFIVLQSDPAVVKEHIGGEEISFKIMCDPDQELFRLYGVEPGNIFQYIAPSVIMKAVKASRRGFSHGAKEGNEMQRPAVFIIDKNKSVTFAYYGKNIGDLPENEAIFGRLKGA
jgi:peroxiredoxin